MTKTISSIILKILFFALFLSIFGCSQKTTVILLSDPDGHTGLVTVSSTAGSVELDQPGEITTIVGQNSLPSAPEIKPEEDIYRQFSEVLTTLPEQPNHFILYFNKGSTALSSDSYQVVDSIIANLRPRQSYDISVIAHSDTAGNRDYNLRLSQKRAEAVSKLLVEKGVQVKQIKTTSHGEENPLIKTGDNVAEPKNRRVEVVIR